MKSSLNPTLILHYFPCVYFCSCWFLKPDAKTSPQGAQDDCGYWHTDMVSCMHGRVMHCQTLLVFGWLTVLVCSSVDSPLDETLNGDPWCFNLFIIVQFSFFDLTRCLAGFGIKGPRFVP